MNLIAIDTSTSACSVALLAGQRVLTRFDIMPARHTEVVIPWVDLLLAEAGIRRCDLDAIGVAIGPGTFTGVRLGISVAQGFAFGLQRRLIPLSTLHLLALQAPTHAKNVLACLDARMGEIYVGCFQRDATGALSLLVAESVCLPEAFVLPQTNGLWYALGSGLDVENKLLSQRINDHCLEQRPSAYPNAADMLPYASQQLAQGQTVDPARVEPIYLRQRVAWTLAERRSGAAKKAT